MTAILILRVNASLMPQSQALAPQPNKTKPPLQVLAVAKGNNEKIKVWDEARDGHIGLSIVWANSY